MYDRVAAESSKLTFKLGVNFFYAVDLSLWSHF